MTVNPYEEDLPIQAWGGLCTLRVSCHGPLQRTASLEPCRGSRLGTFSFDSNGGTEAIGHRYERSRGHRYERGLLAILGAMFATRNKDAKSSQEISSDITSVIS